MLLNGEVVVVIGGSSGIGEAVARAAMNEGATVVIGGRSPERLSAAQARLGGDMSTLPVDVTEPETIHRLFAEVGKIDHLVITAGGEVGGTIRNLDPDSLRPAMEARFWGPLTAVKAALPGLSATGSVTFISGAAVATKRGAPLWHVLPGLVESMTRVLASELAPIRVNAVSPGIVATPRTERLQGGRQEAEKFLEDRARESLLGRVGYPDDIAQAIVFLMTNKYATGTILAVDGGSTFL